MKQNGRNFFLVSGTWCLGHQEVLGHGWTHYVGADYWWGHLGVGVA